MRGLFERFTHRARQVVVLAQEESREMGHASIATEHLLLGLLRTEDGLAARVLRSVGVTPERARPLVIELHGPEAEVSPGQIPFTPRAKQVLELALRESVSLGHNYIGTEHILLGLARENGGVAARVLLQCDADAEKIRNEVMRMLPADAVTRRLGGSSEDTGASRVIQLPLADSVRELLVAASALAAKDRRRAVEPRDVLLALAGDQSVAPLLASLGVDTASLTRILERPDDQGDQGDQRRLA